MAKITVGWMYPNLLNLHGERGSIQMLEKIGKEMGLEMDIRRIEEYDDPIPFQELDMMIFLPGEIASFAYLIPALNGCREQLDEFIHQGHYVLALGTTGLMFGKEVLREDGSVVKGLGYLDMTAKERKYVWGDDLHFRLEGTKQELVGSQIQMADVDAKTPLGTTIYGMGNNRTGAEGCRYRNLIYTNCLGPLFVKNPWLAQWILMDTCCRKLLSLETEIDMKIASDSFASTLRFIESKPKNEK